VISGKDDKAGKTDAVEQAADWMARITDPEASSSDFREWQEWINASPAHVAAYQEIEEIWALTGRVVPAAPAQTASKTLDCNRALPRWRRRPAYVYATAATLVAVAIGIGIWLLPKRHVTYELETATAEQRSMQLADGSHLVLGAETKVSIDLTAISRSLVLDHGVAYFKVAPDKARPFTVESNGSVARAVGTAFSVDSQPGRMLVVVAEGIVQVSRVAHDGRASGSESQMLVHAGQRVSADETGLRCSLAPNSSGAAPSWVSGRLEYLREELRFVIADVNRYSQHKIILHDNRIGHHLYTGTVLLEHVDEWVATLPGSFPVRVGSDDSDRFVLYAAGDLTSDHDDLEVEIGC
jgi:transmembrane sensor